MAAAGMPMNIPGMAKFGISGAKGIGAGLQGKVKEQKVKERRDGTIQEHYKCNLGMVVSSASFASDLRLDAGRGGVDHPAA